MPDKNRNQSLNRRQFLSDNFAAATSFGVAAAFMSLSDRMAWGETPARTSNLQPVKDETTGLPLIRLPEGFRYKTYGWQGDVMSDGVKTPAAHDGMAVILADENRLTLCRNHEVSEDGPAIPFAAGNVYDPRAKGGCTKLVFNTETEQFESSEVVSSGTSRNCAGGVTPWGTWLTAEETVMGPGDFDTYNENAPRTFQQSHGWVFEVPVDGSAADARPIKDMGRFVHEAIAIDRNTGVVYLTEDRETAGFYRFTPNQREQMSAGGTLEIAEVVGRSDLRGGVDHGQSFDVKWHKIDNPTWAHTPGTKDELGVYRQGAAKGGSTFARLEGCWFGNGLVYFDATSGGAAKAGQIWQFDPDSQRLTLLFESPNKPTLNMPDNLAVSPRGGIILCEDNDYGPNQYPQCIFGLSQSGQLQLFAENNVVLNGEHNAVKGDYRAKEWAGATFSPDGKWLFVNIQTPGFTCAITGPWQDTVL